MTSRRIASPKARSFYKASSTTRPPNKSERITELVPDYLPARLILATLYVNFNRPEKALAMIPEIRAQAEATVDPGIGKYDILAVEAQALFAANRTEEAERSLRENMEKYPKDLNLLSLVFKISAVFKSYTNALMAVNHALEMRPDDPAALANKGYVAIQAGDFQTAIPALTTALSFDTNNVTAKLNRAIAYLGNGQLDEAQRTMKLWKKSLPMLFQSITAWVKLPIAKETRTLQSTITIST